jgi:hypothetical protein
VVINTGVGQRGLLEGLLEKVPERFHNFCYLQTYLGNITVSLENYAYDPVEKNHHLH